MKFNLNKYDIDLTTLIAAAKLLPDSTPAYSAYEMTVYERHAVTVARIYGNLPMISLEEIV